MNKVDDSVKSQLNGTKPEVPPFVAALAGARARLSAAAKVSLVADPRLGEPHHVHFAVSHIEACMDALVSLLMAKDVITSEEFNEAVIPAIQHHATTMCMIADNAPKELVIPGQH